METDLILLLSLLLAILAVLAIFHCTLCSLCFLSIPRPFLTTITTTQTQTTHSTFHVTGSAVDLQEAGINAGGRATNIENVASRPTFNSYPTLVYNANNCTTADFHQHRDRDSNDAETNLSINDKNVPPPPYTHFYTESYLPTYQAATNEI